MRNIALASLCLVVLLFSTTLPAQQFGPTTLSAESAGNTSSSTSFAGLSDNRTLTPAIITKQMDSPGNRNISKIDSGAPHGGFGDVHTLLYSGFNGKVFVETQSWFCDSSTTGAITTTTIDGVQYTLCNNHQETGYNSNDVTQDHTQIDDMFRRGFDGFITDVMGDPNGCGYPNFNTSCATLHNGTTKVQLLDTAVDNMRTYVNQTYASSMQYALMYDQSSFLQLDCGTANLTQPACVEGKMLHDLGFYNTKYFGDSTYLKIGGIPVVLSFIAENGMFSQCNTSTCNLQGTATCTGTDSRGISNCWDAIWNTVASQFSLKLIFRNQGGFGASVPNPPGNHPDSSGAFAWVNPPSATDSSQQTNWNNSFGSNTDQNYLGLFYHQAECIYNGGCTGETAIASMYKGFDDEDANFGNHHMISQMCGQTWLNTFNKVSGLDHLGNQYFSTAHQLPFALIDTWDDYDEGTEIETGIDNCVDENSFSIGQPDHTTSLSWDFNFSDTTYGTVATVDRYRLFFTTSTDGTNLFGFDVFPTCTQNIGSVTCSGVNLNSLQTWQAGTYRIYIKALGKPSVTNHMFQNAFATFTPSTVNAPVKLDFGTVTPPQTSTQTITVSLSGSFDVTINSLSINQSGSVFQLQTSPGCVMTQSSPNCQISIKYTPINSNGDTGTLVIGHNGANGSTTVPLTGNGGTGGCTTTTTVSGVDDMSGWSQTSGSATSTLTQNVSSPSLDGASAQFKLTGGVGYSDAKWEIQLGPNDNASEFQLDLQAQVDQPNNVQMLEFGVSQMIGGKDYAFHFACDIKNAGVWKVWNAASNAWSNTTLACSASTFPAGTWVHLIFDAQRTTGNQLQYNWLSINGTQTTIGQTFNPNVESPDNVESSIVLHGDIHNDPYTVTIDSMKVIEIATCP